MTKINFFLRTHLVGELEKNVLNLRVRKYFGYALILVAISMPLYRQAISISVILLLIVWICEGNFFVKLKLLLNRPLILAFIVFYILFILGILYTQNIEVGKSNIEKKLTLLLLPLVIGTSISYDDKIKKNVLMSFVLSCLIASIICLGNAIYHFFHLSDPSYFFHESLTSIIDLHPPFFGMYISFSVLIALNCLWKNRNTFSNFKKICIGLLCIYFLVFIILLSARTATLFLMIYFVIVVFYFFATYEKKGLVLLIFIAIISIVTLIISQSTYLKERILKPITSNVWEIDGGKETGLSIRLIKWKCSIKGISENPYIGVGTGDAVDYLIECYVKENFWGMYPQYRFNSHNQFLETGLTLGLLGLFIFSICIIIPFVSAWRKPDLLALSFIALFCFCCLTESMLERQWGIVFFTLFIPIFHFSPNGYELK